MIYDRTSLGPVAAKNELSSVEDGPCNIDSDTMDD